MLQSWLVGLTGLADDLVRPAWQPDPPPIPAFETPCWIAISIMRLESDWDAVTQHWSGTEGPGGPCDTVYRSQTIHLILTFYGKDASDYATIVRMGAGLKQNDEALGDWIRLVSVDEQVNVSEYLKGRWQKRVDVGVVLRRAVQFTYAVLDVAGTYGTIYSEEAPPIDFDAEAPTTKE